MSWFKKQELDEVITKIKEEAKNNKVSYLLELNKLLPKKPLKSGVSLYKGFLFDEYSCPSCAAPVGDEMLIFNYCPRCGQKLDKHDI